MEDDAADAELLIRELRRAGMRCEWRCVQVENDFRGELGEFAPDVVLSDFSMPHFDGMSALAITREVAPDVPFIFVSGTLGEEYAIRALKNGATDYIMKTNLIRLPSTVEKVIQDARGRVARRRVEVELEETRDRLYSILSSLRDVVWSVEVPSSKVLYVSEAAVSVYQRPPQAFYDDPNLWFDVVHPEDRERVMRESGRAKQGDDVDLQYRVVWPDGRVRWLEARVHPVCDLQGNVFRLDGISEDITRRRKQEKTIAHLTRIYAVLSGVNALLVRVRDREEIHREACRIAVEVGEIRMAWLGVYDRESKTVTPVAWHGHEEGFLSHVTLGLRDPRPEGRGLVRRVIREGRPVIVNDIVNDATFRLKDEALARGYQSAAVLPLLVSRDVVGVLGLLSDEPGYFDDEEVRLLLELAGAISFALDHIEKGEKLHYLAYYDSLTGLANETSYRQCVNRHLHTAARSRQGLAVLLIDLDRFKNINDSLGRQAGDQLLKQAAERVRLCVTDAEDVARIGADCFAVVLPDVHQESDVAHLIESEIMKRFTEPFWINGEELRTSAKVGVSLYPNDGPDTQALFASAEAALKKAKATGERYLFYTQKMSERVAQKLSLENKLRNALENEEYVLYYQPKVDLETRRVQSVEALIRWRNPELGLVPPAEFIPLMEETGLILDVGSWALRRAARDHRNWLEQGLAAPRVAVNVSSIQLRKRDFVKVVIEAISVGASPPGIDLEITESLIMENLEENIGKLQAIRELGINVAIDDFGTGYSSLAYLAKLPVQSLKIDRSFVMTMLKDSDRMTLVSTIITLAHALKLKVVAEGVESEEQAKVLRLLKCDAIQGFLVSKPLPFDEMSTLLKTAGVSP